MVVTKTQEHRAMEPYKKSRNKFKNIRSKNFEQECQQNTVGKV
jgi:hypothetical protein